MRLVQFECLCWDARQLLGNFTSARQQRIRRGNFIDQPELEGLAGRTTGAV